LAEAQVSVDIIVHSAKKEDGSYELSFSTTKEDLNKVTQVLENAKLQVQKVQKNLTKVSMVGSGMRSHSGVAARVFETLHSKNVEIVCTTTSEINISCVIESDKSELAIQSLHEEFNLGS
jgi:aspartate kinase